MGGRRGLRVIAPDVIGLPIELEHFDLSLAKRRATKNGIVYDAAQAMKRAKLGLKAATISVVRMAVGDAYGAKEWREGTGDEEVAFRTERIERGVCRVVAEYAFYHARKTGSKVFGGPKYTVSPRLRGDA